MNTYEKELQAKILAYLTSLGYYAFKTQVSNKRGVHDIVSCVEGKFVTIEVKKIGGVVSKLQILTKNKILHSKGYSIITDNLKDVVNLIKGIKND